MTDNEKLERALTRGYPTRSGLRLSPEREQVVRKFYTQHGYNEMVQKTVGELLGELEYERAASEARVEAVEGQRDALLAKLANSTGHDVVFGPTAIRHDPGRCLICDTRRAVLSARPTEERHPHPGVRLNDPRIGCTPLSDIDPTP